MPNVAVISSLVMHGSVGLRATQFALERRGASVIAVPTVTMPWHPGLGASTRTVAPDFAAQLDELAALAPAIDAVATGYFAAADQIESTARFIDTVRAARPDALVGIDPVMGDEGGRYVSDSVAEGMKEHLVPRADIVTPNRFELEDLSGMADPVDGARSLARRLVFVTSAAAPDGYSGAMLVTDEEAVDAQHAAFARAPNGTGDLFFGIAMSALLAKLTPANVLAEATAGTFCVVRQSQGPALALAAAQAAVAAPEHSALTITRHGG